MDENSMMQNIDNSGNNSSNETSNSSLNNSMLSNNPFRFNNKNTQKENIKKNQKFKMK